MKQQSMPTDSDRLASIERRQEALVSAIGNLTEVVGTTNAMVAELAAWLKEPPSSDLPGILENLAQAVREIYMDIKTLPERVAAVVNIDDANPHK
jgi:ABC-type transporter Mla subunit MlaD